MVNTGVDRVICKKRGREERERERVYVYAYAYVLYIVGPSGVAI